MSTKVEPGEGHVHLIPRNNVMIKIKTASATRIVFSEVSGLLTLHGTKYKY